MLSLADLFLIPSRSETFGLAALEAMGCGVPVISSDIGGLPEVNLHGETGYLCGLDDIDCMGSYAVRILGNDSLHKEMSVNARKQAERFELNHLVGVYESYYEEVAEGLKQA